MSYSPNLSQIKRDIELDDEIKRCRTSLLQSKETNVECLKAHKNAERVLLNQDIKIVDLFKAAKERWSNNSSKIIRYI